MRARHWWTVLFVLALARIVPPLVALVAEGREVPGLPRFDLVTGTGDDSGFYAAAREFIAALARVSGPLAVAGGLATTGVAVAAFRLWPRSRLRPWLVVGLAATVGLVVCLPILEMQSAGSPVLGWSLVWALPLLPWRVLGLPLDYDVAFALGLPLGLAANVVTLVATAYAGRYATGRRAVGLIAAACLALWPLLSRPVAGAQAWDNGTWLVDTGLALYTEPLSTALVAVAAALLLKPGRTDLHLALAGVLLSYATFVKLSNGVTALFVFVVVVWLLGPRRALPLAAGGLSFLAPLAAYWPLGYAHEENGTRNLLPRDPFSLEYGLETWRDSTLFTPTVLAILLPIAAIGALVLRRGHVELALLVALIAGNVAVYTFYGPTPIHPRFFFASLPALFVLVGAAVVAAVERLSPAPTARERAPRPRLD